MSFPFPLRSRLELASLTLDASLQCRVAVNEQRIDEYAAAMQSGVTFPPVIVFVVDPDPADTARALLYVLADGWHRVLAAQRLGAQFIMVELHIGSRADAFWYAMRANVEHGALLTDADKRRAIQLALLLWPDRSQREIAEQIQVSRAYVADVADDLMAAREDQATDVRHVSGRDGKAYPANDAARLQKRQQVAALLQQGATKTFIKTSLHVGTDMLRAVSRELGLPDGRARRTPAPAPAQRHPQHDEIVQRLRAGERITHVARALHVAPAHIAEVCRSLQLTQHGTTRVQRAQRIVDIKRMADEGYNSRQIAAAVHVTPATCRYLMRREAIQCPGDLSRSRLTLNSTRILDHIVDTADNLTTEERLIDFSQVDPVHLSACIRALKTAHSNLSAFIGRLKIKEHEHDEAETTTTRVESQAGPIGQISIPPAYVIQRPFIPSLGARIANELDLNKLGFPVVKDRESKYFCIDGQHRLYALKANDFRDDDLLDCEVYEDLSDEEMADLFLGRDDRTAISPFAKFHIACTAGYTRENAIRRVVEAHGLRIKRAREDNAVGAVSSLCRIYDTSHGKDVAVGWVVRVAKQAFNGDPGAFDASLLEALGTVNNRYNGVPGSKLSEKELIARLSAMTGGPRRLLQKGQDIRERTGQGKVQCIASVIVDLYNKHCVGKARLAPWWKESKEAAS